MVAQVFRLHLLLNIIVRCRINCCFYWTRLQFVEIDILFCLWYQLKKIEMLFLTQLDQWAQLTCSYFLTISCSIIHSLSHNKTSLLCKTSQILFKRHWITLICLCISSHLKWIRLNFFHFRFQLFLFEFLRFQFFFGHSLPDFLHFIKAVVF